MAEISGLYNTAEGFADNTQDTHYALSVVQGNSSVGDYGYVGADAEISPNWIANDTVSKWLAPLQNANAPFDTTALGSTVDGIYRWRLQFDLSGYDPNTASMTLRVASDNDIKIDLNGTEIAAYENNKPALNHNNWRNIDTVSSGFSAGMNIIDFYVKNWLVSFPANPTGLRVEFTETSVNAGQANAIMFSCNT